MTVKSFLEAAKESRIGNFAAFLRNEYKGGLDWL